MLTRWRNWGRQVNGNLMNKQPSQAHHSGLATQFCVPSPVTDWPTDPLIQWWAQSKQLSGKVKFYYMHTHVHVCVCAPTHTENQFKYFTLVVCTKWTEFSSGAPVGGDGVARGLSLRCASIWRSGMTCRSGPLYAQHQGGCNSGEQHRGRAWELLWETWDSFSWAWRLRYVYYSPLMFSLTRAWKTEASPTHAASNEGYWGKRGWQCGVWWANHEIWRQKTRLGVFVLFTCWVTLGVGPRVGWGSRPKSSVFSKTKMILLIMPML